MVVHCVKSAPEEGSEDDDSDIVVSEFDVGVAVADAADDPVVEEWW